MLFFVVTGRIASVGQIRLAWTEKDGFDDPTGHVARVIAAEAQVCATPTGPCYRAASSPAHVALLTALYTLDVVEDVKGDEVQAQLSELCAIPAGAIP
jgi:hypothetical protein